MKIIAFYLPQFHSIPENDEWWGKGFTEWTNVKKGKKYFKWQKQPRIPLDNNYYCLLDEKTQEWQAKIAEEHGIYGFCYYHYWFDGHLLLEKPMENMLRNKNIKLPFCICWANEDWTNAWVSSNAKTLISQTYGDKDEWKRHYDYLKQFFCDERYIKVDGKLLFVIYRPEIINCLSEMLKLWNDLAIKDGFGGIKFAHQGCGLDFPVKQDDSIFDYDIEMQPLYGKNALQTENKTKRISRIKAFLQKMKMGWVHTLFRHSIGPRVFDYSEVWSAIIEQPPISNKSIPCAFVDFDNTPRRHRQGWLFKGCNLDAFKKYMSLYLKKAKEQYNTDLMFIFAWNEWGEGGYLEPDTDNGYGYLNIIKDLNTNTDC